MESLAASAPIAADVADGDTQFAFGIDVGGSCIKGACVDLATGQFTDPQTTIPTPQPATPSAVAEAIATMVQKSRWDRPVGIAFPSVIKDQVALTAANIDASWVNENVYDLIDSHIDANEIAILNDADAAGLAEVAFGDPAVSEGAVIFLTFGTGIGSAFFINGDLFPNTELGHMTVGGSEAEHQAASAVKERDGLSFTDWAGQVDVVLREFERIFNPRTFVVGGGISQQADLWVPHLTVETPVVAAKLRNRAGIIGAAMAASHHVTP